MTGAAALHQDALVWDAHSCLPLIPGIGLEALARHRRAGVDFVSVNVGMDMNPLDQVLRVIASFRAWLQENPAECVLAGTVAEVRQAKAEGRLAVAFDLEGAMPLLDDPDMVAVFHRLGVRQIHLAYNRNNAVAGGCHDEPRGLTALGRQVVAAINRAGMLMDCSHTGIRSSLEIMEVSTKPVVFSHANPRALVDHPRNVTDEQMAACAATGGVVGINGIGLFLGDPNASSAAMVRHIDHAVGKIGVAHVGLGLDHSFDLGIDDLPPGTDRAYWWPGYQPMAALGFAPPEQFPEITEGLLRLGYGETDIRAILGGNFARVAEASWGG